ncbi:MAG: hypothetical protein GXP14_07615 [Gammaproteobacteria bacterium]|nr:hypothetical protein [Gammaproteobacteria bacterium]
MNTNKPVCWIIAGPNGAGKTTFALKYLPEVAGCHNFVNADLIAAGLAPLAPEKELLAASRLFLKEVHSYIDQRVSFGFETTLSGRSYLKLVNRLLADDWQVELIYLALPDVEMSIQRVAERVAHGGHSVTEDVIRRRFPRSLSNLLHCFSTKVSSVHCFMNSSDSPEMIFMQNGKQREIVNQVIFNLLIEKAKS